MRMWMIHPSYLCRQHLLGQHVELHMLVACIENGRPLHGYIKRGLVELDKIDCYHEIIAEEMLKRGMVHKSPLRRTLYISGGTVSLLKSIRDLFDRCHECRCRYEGLKQAEVGNVSSW